MIIDIFNHVYPKEYLDALPRPLPERVVRLSSTLRGIVDLDYRQSQMDKMGVDMHVLSLAGPTLDDLPSTPERELPRIARAANDGIANIAEKSHGRFKGIATVSLLDVGQAVDEVERSVKDLGLLGVQVLSNAGGKPLDSKELDPFYAKVSQLGCGLWVHPTDIRTIYDWMNDEYNMNMMIGWAIDTSLAMVRIFRGGVLERYPNLTIIPHHLGALIPLMAARIDRTVMGQGKDGLPPAPLGKTPMEYMKMFYVDTAEGAWNPALTIAHGFFGSSHLLFGTDYPWGNTPGTIKNINSLPIDEEEKKMILAGNAEKLLGIH